MVSMTCPTFEAKNSGPLRVAEFDCHGCDVPCTLNEPKCRSCVIGKLRTEGEMDQVTLLHPIVRTYCSRDLSKLARTIAVAEQLALDRTLYGGKEGEGRCKKCVDGRIAALMESIDKIIADPHDISPLENAIVVARIKNNSECKKCTEVSFYKLVDLIKATLKSSPVLKRLSSKNYDEVFEARMKPFFVEGVWNPPPSQARVIESYDLPNRRGKVKIYE